MRAAVDAEATRRASDTVGVERLRHLAVEVERTAAQLQKLAAGGDGPEIEKRRIEELVELIPQVSDVAEGQNAARLGRLASSIRRLMDMVLYSPSPTAGQFEILRLHGRAIAVAIDSSDAGSAIVGAALREAIRVAEG